MAARIAHSVNGIFHRIRHDTIRTQLFVIKGLRTAFLDYELQPFSRVRVGGPAAGGALKVLIAFALRLQVDFPQQVVNQDGPSEVKLRVIQKLELLQGKVQNASPIFGQYQVLR